MLESTNRKLKGDKQYAQTASKFFSEKSRSNMDM